MLSERLKAATVGTPYFGFASLVTTIDIVKATEVCAAVEAFQAAEQERAAVEGLLLQDRDEMHRYAVAYQAFHAAKARLLEVNLG